jgi:hypothetical protein
MKLFDWVNTHRRACFAVLPIMGCNGTAFTGQLFFLRAHQHTWPEISIIGLAATMESIALFLASEASEREKKGDSSFNVRMSSYAFGLFVGIINYSHYANPGFRPTVFAVIFGSMSALSPWLWALYGRGQAREILIERGLIEPRGVKFAKIRWMLWPRETFGAMRLAAWSGERNPDDAIRTYEQAQAVKHEAAEAIEHQRRLELESREQTEQREREQTEREQIDAVNAARKQETIIHNSLESAASQAERIRIAVKYADATTPNAIIAWLAERGYNGITSANVRTVRNRERETPENASENGSNAPNTDRTDLHAV